jgi:ribosomal protein S18 acetylase RimI-like enzyme
MDNSAKKLPRIRKAKPEDAEELKNIYFEFMQGIEKLNSFYRQDIEYWNKDALKDMDEMLRMRNRRIFLLEDKGRIAGFMDTLIKTRDDIYKIWKTGHIESVYIKPKYRRKGYSKALIEEAMKWFDKRGMKHFTVGAHALNTKARKYWEKLGFKEYFVLYNK